MSKPKQLLITADDFGICNAIDQGIYDSIDALDCIDVFVNYNSTESVCGSSLSLNTADPQTDAERILRRKLCRRVRPGSDIWEFKNEGVPSIALRWTT